MERFGIKKDLINISKEKILNEKKFNYFLYQNFVTKNDWCTDRKVLKNSDVII